MLRTSTTHNAWTLLPTFHFASNLQNYLSDLQSVTHALLLRCTNLQLYFLECFTIYPVCASLGNLYHVP